MPFGDLPGWRLVFEDEFDDRTIAQGDFLDGSPDNFHTSDGRYQVYRDGWTDTTGHGHYDPSIISVHDDMLDMFIHTSGGFPRVAAIRPLPTGGSAKGGLAGGVRYHIRVRADSMPGYKGVPMLWADAATTNNLLLRYGEIDWPESNFDLRPKAYMHHTNATSFGDQEVFPSPLGTRWQDWHDYVIEWVAGTSVEYFLDGVSIGSTTTRIPTEPMHANAQFETQLVYTAAGIPSPAVSGHVYIKSIAIWVLDSTAETPTSPGVDHGDDDLYFGDDRVVWFSGELDEDPSPSSSGVPPPETTETTPFVLTLGGHEVGGFEWTANGEEVVGGIDRALVRVQDRLGSAWEPEPHTEVTIRIRSSGWILFHGESLTPSVDLPPGMPYRIWNIVCRGYTALLPERLVGAPIETFWRPNAREPYRPIDPAAVSSGTDEVTVEDWFDAYFRFPDGTAPDTTTHVHEYIPNAVLGSEEFIMWLYDATTTLQAALEQLAAIADVNIQFWICPDDHVHWVHIPNWRTLIGNSDPTDLEDAPYAIVDLSTNPDGTTEIGHGGIRIEKDGQTMPEQVYVQGATPSWIVDPDNIVNTAEGASGWVPGGVADKQKRQAYLPAPDAWDVTRRDAVANAALARGANATVRATVVVVGFHGEPRDGWRAGQLLSVDEPRLPASMRPGGRFPIQSVGWTLVPGTDLVRYELGIGDGAVSRISQGQRNRIAEAAPAGPAARKPIITWAGVWLDANGNPDNSPIGAGETRNIVADTRNALGEQWGPPGFPVTFVVVAYDEDENVVPGEGSFSPNPTTTDQDGMARSVFTAGSVDGLDYTAFAETEFTP